MWLLLIISLSLKTQQRAGPVVRQGPTEGTGIVTAALLEYLLALHFPALNHNYQVTSRYSHFAAFTLLPGEHGKVELIMIIWVEPNETVTRLWWKNLLGTS